MSTPQSPLAVPDAWNLVSSAYAEEVVPQFTPFAEDAVSLLDIAPGSRVVDVACGPGTWSFVAARRGARVSAVDFAADMVHAFRQRAAREGVEGVDVQVGNGMALPFEDGSFDAGASMFGLMFFPDRVQGFRELARVLRPGGRAAVASWQPMERVPLVGALFAALRAELPQLPFGQGSAPLGDPAEMQSEMLAGGFREVTVHEVAHTLEEPSLDKWWGSMLRTMAPLVLLRQRLGEAQFGPIAESMRRRLVERFGNGPQHAVLIANLGLGTR